MVNGDIEIPMIRIAGKGLLVGTIAKQIATIYCDKQILFYKEEIRDVVEVCKIKHDKGNKSFMGFSVIKPNRFVTLSEQHFTPYVTHIRTDPETKAPYKEDVPTSLSKDKSNIVLASPQFQELMPVIRRIFSVPLPVIYENKLTFPELGYDRRFYSWLNPNAPQISKPDMQLSEAKGIFYKMFIEFCFESKKDYTNALAGFITPFLRGIFPDFTTRTPLFFYIANRERAGKDYLASVTGLVLEGQALDEPPISDGQGNSNKNDELRKKVLASLMQGRRRMHFANNKGKIDNSVLEQTLTSRTISDRILGKNENISLDNEIDFSASGNVGIRFSPDLANRSVFIKLFLELEDANKREFITPNLHAWIIQNRDLILSAVYCLIREWFNNGSKKGSVPFASYPEWASICGGIMENAGYDNPCINNQETLTIGGDVESIEMKALFELAYAKYPEEEIEKQKVIDLIKGEENIFGYIDFNEKSDQIRFGQTLIKFYGRIFSDIRLNVSGIDKRASRHILKFSKIKPEIDKEQIFGKFGNDGNGGNVSNQSGETNNNNNTNNTIKRTTINDPEHYQLYQSLPKKANITDTSFENPSPPRSLNSIVEQDFDQLKKEYEAEGLL